jgi:diguanylate cyclase (GGDEF)-like protein
MTQDPTQSNQRQRAAIQPAGVDYRRAYEKLVRETELEQQALWHFQYFELQVIRSQSLTALLELLLRQSLDYFELQRACLLLLDDKAGGLQKMFHESMEKLPPAVAFTADAQQLQAFFPGGVKVRELPAGSDTEVVGEAFRSIVLPLSRQGELVGCLQLDSRTDQPIHRALSNNRLTHFAALVAICLENCSNRERLRQHSVIDVLTGVMNRRGFANSAQDELARAVRTGMPLTAMFVDLDHFKRVNDQYGHPCGDRVLVEVARTIGEILRPTDLLFRYGGEEFVALLPACDHEQAMGIARRINVSVAALQLLDDQRKMFRVTCSLGFSCWHKPEQRVGENTEVIQRLLGQADRALYLAKQQGRNRACYLDLDDPATTCV